MDESLGKIRDKTMEDEQIIELYWNRKENAIEETSRKYSRLCRTIAMNILGNLPDAEECENDTYLALWNAIPSTRPNHFSAFLSTVVRNKALDQYNRKRRRSRECELIMSELEECAFCIPSAESCFEEKQVYQYINAFLREQKKETRVIFIRRYWYADSITSIAKRMGYTEGKVKTVLFRTRKKLGEYLAGQGVAV